MTEIYFKGIFFLATMENKSSLQKKNKSLYLKQNENGMNLGK